MLATRPSAEARQLLALRRSAGKHFIGEPGPSPEALDELLEIAARVPDHRRMTPWRFIIFEGKSREDFGQELARIRGKRLKALNPGICWKPPVFFCARPWLSQ